MASALKRGSARIYAQKFIIRGLREGLSGNQILQNLRSVSIGNTTLGYRTETFYKDVARYKPVISTQKLYGFKSIPKDFSVNFSIPVPSTGGKRYLYPITLRGTNSDTGEEMVQNAGIVSPIPIDNLMLPIAFQNAGLEENYSMQIDWDNSEILQPVDYSSKWI